MKIFGFNLEKQSTKEETKKLPSFAPPLQEGEALSDFGGGYFYNGFNIEQDFQTENELIRKYRTMALVQEVEEAIEDIMNDMVVSDSKVECVLTNIKEIGENTKKAIRDEFDKILSLLFWEASGYDTCRRWYIEGRIFFHKIIDETNPKKGILEIRPLDSLNIKRYREIKREIDQKTGNEIVTLENEHYIYSPYGLSASTGLRISKDSIAYANCGIFNENRTMALSYLHRAIRPLNQLKMMEDGAVIYRITRAPERRAFYIDVGNLPNKKAESYLNNTMSRFKNRIKYNSKTGEITDNTKEMSVTEDYWFARREGGRGTEVVTLQGGANLGEITDIEYFLNRFLDSLKTPKSRRDSASTFNLGKQSEITRDELKFNKFIKRLRKKFSVIFLDLLRTQLILKNIVDEREWNAIREKIEFQWPEDAFIAETKQTEINRDRLSFAKDAQDFVGKYYSHDYIRREILKQSDEDIETEDELIDKEKDMYATPDDEAQGEI